PRRDVGRGPANRRAGTRAIRVTSMKDDVVDVVIVGAGQAGLSLSHELAAAGRAHVVLERGRIGETWRGRWDSFCLVIPNWTVQLPGGHCRGVDTGGHIRRRAIVSDLRTSAMNFL